MLAALSIDLDEIPLYRALHDLPSAPPSPSERAVHRVALPRALELAAELQLPLTLFVVTRELGHAEARALLREAAQAGHELGSHSHDHPYDLTRLPPAARLIELERSFQLLGELTASPPQGFRAPGYTVTDALLEQVRTVGYRYDSSVFPCPPYYAAKAVILAGYRLLGKSSASVLDHPRVLLAPREPYRMGNAYHRRGQGLVELPVQVTRGPRLPFIGSVLTGGGALAVRSLCRLVSGEPLVNLELHGVDFLDASDGLADLARHVRELNVPWRTKRARLAQVVRELRRAGHRWVTLAQAAAKLFPPQAC